MALSLPTAELVEQTLGCIMYGIYLVTLGIAGRILLTKDGGERWRRRSEIKWAMVIASVLLFINSTLDLVIASITLVQAFNYDGPGGPSRIFTHGSGWQTMIKSFCVPFQSLLGDAILIYRCWFLWNRSWIVIAVPLTVWLVNVAIVMRFLDILSQATRGLIISTAIQPWGQAFWSTTISINILTTSLIVFRIYTVDRQNKKIGLQTASTLSTNSTSISNSASRRPSGTLQIAMRNIIESGMIYTFVSIFTLATYTIGSTWHYPVSALEIHSVGITFNLILIRGARTPHSYSHYHPDRNDSRHPGSMRHTLTIPFQFTHPHSSETQTQDMALSRLDNNNYMDRSREGKDKEREKEFGLGGGVMVSTSTTTDLYGYGVERKV
ncbi:carboxylic ester hydrolase [Favolaschia claudopus]|uniref:Carboxylic ester hydrolase n=1 Tax=Favolaschia claudopus TaxID=2862362 RepID=A0AAW0CLN5_9AGAR